MNILIVDDDEIDTALVKNALNSSIQEPIQIQEADSVKQSLALIENQSFDVILLDYHMPEVDGIELIIDIRSRPHLGNTAIIVISAAHGTDIALQCIEAGAQDFIAKSDISHIKLYKAILHSTKRFELEKKMHDSYLAIKTMAETDQLTGLYNRNYFNENLKFMTDSCKRTGLSVGMLALDIDDFKHVNDTLGHQAGDQLLIEFVERIKECLRQNDGFSRLGGDEFAITLPEIKSIEEVSLVASRILETVNQHFTIDGKRFHCTISIGAAIFPDDANTREELVKCADIAMYRAKQNGKNTLRFYESHYQKDFNRRFEIQNDMSDILDEQRFRLFYQPVFRTDNKQITGLEALIRWPDTPHFYTPDEFIPIAEQSRLIHSLGKWVINTAIKDLSYWQNEHPRLSMAINISAIQFRDPDLISYLIDITQKYKVKPETIILEITETAFLGNNHTILDMLNNLVALKFKIALDDFGMGYSSISHLSIYPIDIVKLDKSLQLSAGVTKKTKDVLEPLAIMLNLLSFELVAEGVETQAQLTVCEKLNVDKVQGYLLGKPMPADKVKGILQS